MSSNQKPYTKTGDIGLLRSKWLAGDGTTDRHTDASGKSGTGPCTAGRPTSTTSTTNLSATTTGRPTKHVLDTKRFQRRR